VTGGRLAGKTALVTGAGGGLGSAIARVFGAEGAHVFVNDVNADAAQRTVDDCREKGYAADAAVGDVSHAGGVEAIFEAVLDDGAPLDVLVTNAGVSTATDPDADVSVNPWDRDIRHVSDASWRRMTATHLDGTFYCIRAAVHSMVTQERGGSIVCMSSMAATAGYGAVHYSAAKAGILGIVRSQARSLGKFNIRINAICPGSIDAGMLRNFPRDRVEAGISQIPLGRLGQADDIAFAALYLASDEAAYVTGQYLSPNGGRVIT
jgi:NAD(P)-dependent dehydrogenase (short-subunit alcohol dehydrogenase family)